MFGFQEGVNFAAFGQQAAVAHLVGFRDGDAVGAVAHMDADRPLRDASEGGATGAVAHIDADTPLTDSTDAVAWIDAARPPLISSDTGAALPIGLLMEEVDIDESLTCSWL